MRRFAVFSAVLLCIVFLSASDRRDSLRGSALFDLPENHETLFMGENGATASYIYMTEGKAYLCAVNANDGTLLTHTALTFYPSRAAQCGDDLYLLNAEDSAAVKYSASAGSCVSETPLNVHGDDVSLFCCHGGDIFLTLSTSPKKLLKIKSPENIVYEFPESIDFVESVGEKLYVSTGSALYLLKSGGYENVSPSVPLTAPICAASGNGLFLDRDGTVLSLNGGKLSPVYRCTQSIYPFSFCFDRENCLILSNDEGSVLRFDENGDLVSSCSVDGTTSAVCSSGCIYKKRRTVYFAPFSFSEPEPSPTPAPEDSEDPPLRVEGEYIIVDEGFTAAQLRELFKPDVVEIRDRNGTLIINGRLSTGMTAGRYIVVVSGDCNGTGTVNRSDLSQAISFSLDGKTLDNASFAAADINGDGVVDGKDLLLITEKFSK